MFTLIVHLFSHLPPPQDDFISTNQTLSDNPLNEDPPQSLSEYITGLNASVMQYVQSVESYLDQANQTMAANVIAEAVVNAVSLRSTYALMSCHIIIPSSTLSLSHFSDSPMFCHVFYIPVLHILPNQSMFHTPMLLGFLYLMVYTCSNLLASIFLVLQQARFSICIRESVDSLCGDGADTPMPPYIGKAFTCTIVEDVSLFGYLIMVIK